MTGENNTTEKLCQVFCVSMNIMEWLFTSHNPMECQKNCVIKLK